MFHRRLSTLLLALTTPFALIGCFGSSSDSDNGNGSGTGLTAVAGEDITAEVGETIELDGSGSISASNDEIVEWRWFSFPSGSSATIADRDAPETTLTIGSAAEGRTIEVFLSVTNAEGVNAQDDFAIEVGGDAPGDADLSDAEKPLLFFSEDAGQEGDYVRKSIHAVDPADPRSDRTAQVDVLATDNARSRSDGGSVAERRGGNEFAADRNTLPLGVLAVELTSDDDLEVGERHAVVFNTPEGELRRVDGFDGLDESVRLSSESDANLVCAAKVMTDYMDVTQSVLAYQIPTSGDRRCTNATQWFAVRFDADEHTAPVKLTKPGTVQGYANDFELGLSPEWVFPLRDDQGAIDDLVVYQGNNNFSCSQGDNGTGRLWRISVSSGDREMLEPTGGSPGLSINDDSICAFRKLISLEDQRHLVQATFHDAGAPTSPRYVFLYDATNNQFSLIEPKDGLPGGALNVAARPTGRDETLFVNDRVYILDIEDEDADTGRLIEIDLDPADVDVPEYQIVDGDWGTGLEPESFVTDGQKLGWTYAAINQAGDAEGTWAVRGFDTDTGDATMYQQNLDLVRPGGLDRTVYSPSAPAGRIYYNQNSPGAARAQSITDSTDSEQMAGSIFLSQSWNRTISGIGEQAEHIFYLTSGELLAVVDAKDFAGSEELASTQVITRNAGSASAEGYGTDLLMGLQQGTSTQVYYVNPETAEFRGLSTIGRITAPISFHH
ncbi:hypothetical protein ACNSTU_00250 [Aquisalimonas sp. APHAB1-3]|uniref:hypothetical protein n=1 Tax=Aquisalimonas sp. APHAB1-3 TaxID=3402080 RepID=UPI003AAE2846